MYNSIKYWNQRRYTAWYNPSFFIDDAYYEHASEDDRIRAYIEHIRKSIAADGLQNPLLVTRKAGTGWIIHPGKCRAKALKQLGYDTAPAIVVDYMNPHLGANEVPEGCIYLYSPEQVANYLSGDCVVEMSHRWLTVKKKR